MKDLADHILTALFFLGLVLFCFYFAPIALEIMTSPEYNPPISEMNDENP